jgi:hypothetical protein
MIEERQTDAAASKRRYRADEKQRVVEDRPPELGLPPGFESSIDRRCSFLSSMNVMATFARMIVDSNYLQSEGLRAYLAASPNHYAVLCDYAAMEAYKGDTLASIAHSMSILRKFPEQVIVLRDTTAICLLTDRSSDPQERMIDREQTKDFPTFCTALNLAETGQRSCSQSIARQWTSSFGAHGQATRTCRTDGRGCA